MSVRIASVKLVPNYTWDSVENLADWNAVRSNNTSWQSIAQTTITNQSVKIEVDIKEKTWMSLKQDFVSWNTIKSSISNWLGIKND